MKNELLLSLYKQPVSVFTVADIHLLLPEISYKNLKAQLSYLKTTGGLKRLCRGIYAKEKYDVFELANKLYSPSYISLETVLRQAGIIFQYYERIFVASYLTRTIEVDGKTIEYRRLKKEILLNREGVENIKEAAVASPERAFLDAVYIYKNYHFDNLNGLDWDKVNRLKNIYHSRVLLKRVEDYARLR